MPNQTKLVDIDCYYLRFDQPCEGPFYGLGI